MTSVVHNTCMGIARIKYDKEIEQEGKKRRVKMERSTASKKKKVLD